MPSIDAETGIRSRLIPISDPGDPRIAAYRDIRERDLAGRRQRFVAEGRVVLNVLFSASRFRAESVLLRANRVAGLQPLIDRIPDDIPIYVAKGTVMDDIAGFAIHRGILAIGLKSQTDGRRLMENLPARALIVALAGIANHDNMGSIFRNAAAFGADALLLNKDCCDPLYRKAIRVSVGAVLKVPYAGFPDIGTLIATLRDHEFSITALSPTGRQDISSMPRSERQALLLGSEGTGLPPAIMRELPTARIAMADDFDSLNVAAASAIALHRMWRRPADA